MNCHAQTLDWAPIGAKWYYEERYFGSADTGYVKIESIKDTLIKGHWSKMLQLSKVTYELVAPLNYNTVFYTYKSNDSIYLYNTTLNDFQLIYIENLTVGDTLSISWEINTYGNCNYVYVVDSVSTFVLNGKNIRKTVWKDISNNIRIKYYEGIGGNDIFTLLLYKSSCANGLVIDGTFYNLRCYEHPVYGLFKFTPVSCNATYQEPAHTLNWLNNGAEWYYGEAMNNGDTNYVKIRCIKDTVINTKTTKLIEVNKNSNVVQPFVTGTKFYTYKSNDTVYFYNFITQQFAPIFINNLQTGNMYNVNWAHNNGVCNYAFRADSINYLWINGFLIRQVTLTNLNNNQRYHYLENIGGRELLSLLDDKVSYCNYPVVSQPSWYLRCYLTPAFTIKFRNEPCNYITGVKEFSMSQNRIYYYNDYLYLNLMNEQLFPLEISVTDVLGRLIKKAEVSNPAPVYLNLPQQVLYVLMVKDKMNRYYIFKFVN